MPGLITGEAPFIRQPYELYTEENHQAWRALYARLLPRWERYAACRVVIIDFNGE